MTDTLTTWHQAEHGYWCFRDDRGHQIMRLFMPSAYERKNVREAYIAGVRRGREMAQPPLPLDSMDLASRVSRTWP